MVRWCNGNTPLQHVRLLHGRAGAVRSASSVGEEIAGSIPARTTDILAAIQRRREENKAVWAKIYEDIEEEIWG